MGNPVVLRQIQGAGRPVVSGPSLEWNPGVMKGWHQGTSPRLAVASHRVTL